MQIKNSSERYGAIAQLLHWTIVGLIVTQFVLASQAEDTASLLQKAKILTTHKSVGLTIFMLAIVRLGWRWANPVPTMPSTVPSWQRWIAHGMHWGLYALILLTPLAGWLMSSAKNYTVSYFGLFSLPNLVAPSEELFEILKERHEMLAEAIFVLAILHILAALKHHFFDKDNVLRRMLPMKLR